MNIRINAHSSLRAEYGKTVYFDPFNITEENHDADAIFITHSHFEHFSPDDIVKVKNDTTLLVAPKSMSKDLAKAGLDKGKVILMEVGDFVDVGDMRVTAVMDCDTDNPMQKNESSWLRYKADLGDGKEFYVGRKH